jgi:hypothetical protein
MDYRKSAIAGASDRTLTRSISKIRVCPACSRREIAARSGCRSHLRHAPSLRAPSLRLWQFCRVGPLSWPQVRNTRRRSHARPCRLSWMWLHKRKAFRQGWRSPLSPIDWPIREMCQKALLEGSDCYGERSCRDTADLCRSRVSQSRIDFRSGWLDRF